MSISQTSTISSEIGEAFPCDFATRKYMAALSRQLAHECVLEAFIRSGLTKAELARRLELDPSRLNKLINTPGNITVETLGELLYAIDGSGPTYACESLTDKSPRNYHGPDWLLWAKTPSVPKSAFKVTYSTSPGVKNTTTRPLEIAS